MLLLAASLFFTAPAPLEMPRAEAHLVTEGSRRRLEDRFNRLDLWTSRTVDGRWLDDDGRVFTLSRLAFHPPSVDAGGSATRTAYSAEAVAFDRRKAVARDGGTHAVAFRSAISLLSPFLPSERGVPPRQMPRGYADVDYWHGTNESAVVCTFLPEGDDVWRLAVWELAPGDDFAECLKAFEREFLESDYADFARRLASPRQDKPRRNRPKPGSPLHEREALRGDARHSVAAYESWHVADSDEFTILDDLPGGQSFVSSLTNELPVLRRRYAAVMPTGIDGSNVLCVARIFADRGEYLDALAVDGLTNMAWSAAYWSPSRRELVAHLPEMGEKGLLRTFRHEAFHQYLSYALAMIPASPWLNEGYAQFFEDETSLDWELGFRPGQEDLEKFSVMLRGIFAMDYAAFYAGSDDERRLKYRLAWSVAVFMERGMREIRRDPFSAFKRDYVEELFRSQDMLHATNAAFGDKDRLDLFVSEWLRFWKDQ